MAEENKAAETTPDAPTEKAVAEKTTRISEVELLKLQLLVERQTRMGMELSAAQATTQAHIAQIQKTHGLTDADVVDAAGVITRAPAAPPAAPGAPPPLAAVHAFPNAGRKYKKGKHG